MDCIARIDEPVTQYLLRSSSLYIPSAIACAVRLPDPSRARRVVDLRSTQSTSPLAAKSLSTIYHPPVRLLNRFPPVDAAINGNQLWAVKQITALKFQGKRRQYLVLLERVSRRGEYMADTCTRRARGRRGEATSMGGVAAYGLRPIQLRRM
jgi:hypothetical protein